MSELPSHARVVIVGGGIVGVGLLYHLGLEGWKDCVLVEKGELTSGSTWHAAGQCPHFNGSFSLSKIHVYGTELYPKLAELTGQQVSWHGCGGIRLAVTDEEVDWFHRVQAMSGLLGYEAHVIGPDEIKEHHPFLETFGVKAGFLTVTDGHVAPADVTNAMAAGSRALGATISRRNRCTNIKLLPSGEWLVETEKGSIICQHVVNAAGSYADIVAGWTGHKIPLANMLHHYIITEPLQELIDMERELPVVRDPYSHGYLREETNGILIGTYETSGAHSVFDDTVPWEFESELLPPELDRLVPWLERATERLPLFGKAGIKSVISGAITHTPDGNFLLGPAAGPANYWMAAGVSIGICQGAGMGKYLAQWMVHGAADINMGEFDPRRFGDWADKDFARITSISDYQHMYTCMPPGKQHEAGRERRVSTLYERLKAAGGQYQQVGGWERVRWYDTKGEGENYSYRRSNWWEPVKEEALAVRKRVGLMDLSTFAKYEITGADAMAFLDRLLANRLPRKDGGIALTHFLTDSGRIEGEMTVTRFAVDRFFALSGAAQQDHDLDLMRRELRPGEKVTIKDVTEAFGTLVLAGPRSRDVLSQVTKADLSNAAFPWLSAREIEVAGVPVRALRVNYIGELGWELYVPMDKLPLVFDALMAAGQAHAIRLFGTYALNALRVEKGYRGMWGELTNEIDMFEGDMARFIALDKGEFKGRTASLAAKQRGPRMSLVHMAVEAVDADCLGNEPIYHQGRLVGITTSGGYGFALKQSFGYGYVEPALAAGGTVFEIELTGRRVKANVLAAPPYDPTNLRLKA